MIKDTREPATIIKKALALAMIIHDLGEGKAINLIINPLLQVLVRRCNALSGGGAATVVWIPAAAAAVDLPPPPAAGALGPGVRVLNAWQLPDGGGVSERDDSDQHCPACMIGPL